MEELTLKQQKEAFVSNLHGSSIAEINLVTAVAPASYILFAVLQKRYEAFKNNTLFAFLLDFGINVGALLLGTTVLSDRIHGLLISLIIPAGIALLRPGERSDGKDSASKKAVKQDASVQDPLPQKPFITIYRASMLTVTAIAILAVDFPLFPRRFAKVETWGTSLMDMGVGAFVFSGGLVGARPLLKSALTSQPQPNIFSRMTTALRHSIPLLLLGCARLAAVKGVDYAEHVTEYGVHWNFFFTLGMLGPFVAILQSVPMLRKQPGVGYAVLAIAVGAAYQYVLLGTDLQSYVLGEDRRTYGLLSANKEGLASFVGYLAIFLAGLGTGSRLLPGSSSLSSQTLMWPLLWIALFVGVHYEQGLNIPVSRRLANLPYVLWVVAFNTTQLSAFAAVDAITRKVPAADRVPPILRAINFNGMAVFLIANLMTGLVNMSINTLAVETHVALAVLTAYMLSVALVALGMEKAGIKVKL